MCMSASEQAMERHVCECTHTVNILILVSLSFRIVICLSCLWSVLRGSGPLSLHPLECRPGTPPLLTPDLRQIHLRQRDPEMRSLSLWGDGKLSSRATPQNKTKAFSTLAPQVPTGRTPTFLSRPPAPSTSGPSRRPLPGNLCRVSAAAATRKTSSRCRPGVRVVWWKFAGKEEGDPT